MRGSSKGQDDLLRWSPWLQFKVCITKQDRAFIIPLKVIEQLREAKIRAKHAQMQWSCFKIELNLIYKGLLCVTVMEIDFPPFLFLYLNYHVCSFSLTCTLSFNLLFYFSFYMYLHICTQVSIHVHLSRKKQQKVFVSDDDFSTQLVLDSWDGKFHNINNKQQWQYDYNSSLHPCV